MPAPFTTFFGDYLHGLWVTWKTEDIGGSVGFKATFQANYRARRYTYGNSDAGDVGPDYDYKDASGGQELTSMTADEKRYMMYVAWTNPDSTSTVAKDGIAAVSECILTVGAQLASSQPTLKCTWAAKDPGVIAYDIKPTASWDWKAEVMDATDDVNFDATDNDGNICTELWKLTTTSIACVEMRGSVTRKFNTGDTTDDFILDYTSYQMHAKFGKTNENDNVYKFNEQTVNFAELLANETNFGMMGISAISGVSVLGSLFAMLA